ncbi:hypothetical protein [Amycolatopsis sp. NPDC102389]|uniref:hypothetical protein n=1 Tax=Amycolatopsis sp. NPDC102389 TaxID=3363941 RepID=UPI0038052E4A
MAPPGRSPEPGHPVVQGLDRKFGHEGEIVAWVRWLLEPFHDGSPGRCLTPTGAHESDTPSKNGGGMTYPYESVIQGRFLEQFFDPAFALSGQELAPDDDEAVAAQVHKALEDARWDGNNHVNALAHGYQSIKNQVADPERFGLVQAETFLGSVIDYMEDFCPLAEELAKLMTAYAGIIVKAREDLNEVMGRLVDAVHDKYYAQGSPDFSIALSTIAGALGTAATGGTVPMVWGTALITFLSESAKEGAAPVKGPSWEEIFNSYLVAQADVLGRAETQLSVINRRIDSLAGRLPAVPHLAPG